MRVNEHEHAITLSRRNLLALLHKLEMEGSKRTIISDGGDGWAVTVEVDEEHYKDRIPPGIMHPSTEEFIARMGEFLDGVRE